MGTFVTQMRKLIRATPKRIEGHLAVDQVYAHYQHAHLEFNHPDGGEAMYLSTPLFTRYRDFYDHLAKQVFHGELVEGMTEVTEELSHEVYVRAPWEFGDLRASGHPFVEADGETVYDRQPNRGRLSAEELKIKGELRYLFGRNGEKGL